MTEGDENLTRSAPSGDKNSAAPRRAATTTVDPRLEDDATGPTQQSGVRAGWRFRDGRSMKPTIADPLDAIGGLEPPDGHAPARLSAVPVLPPIVPGDPLLTVKPPAWVEQPLVWSDETAPPSALVISPMDEPVPRSTTGAAPAWSPLHDLDAIATIESVDDRTTDDDEQTGVDAESSGVVDTERRRPIVFHRRARSRVRRVTRVVRHVDTWSVFKVALVFNAVIYVVCITAGVLLWNVAYTTGTINNVEKFFEQFGWSSFQFNGGEIFHAGWIAGLFGAIGLTGFAVLLATVFNLITDLVGGIRVSVLEEEVTARPARPPLGVETEPSPESSTQSSIGPDDEV